MTQLPLLPPAAAKSDPWTSFAAARRINRDGTRQRQVELVARLVAAHPGCTSAELAVATGHDRAMIARRLCDAERLGLVRCVRDESDEKRKPIAKTCSVNGGAAMEWHPR
jgi:predicted transcriptional regulator